MSVTVIHDECQVTGVMPLCVQIYVIDSSDRKRLEETGEVSNIYNVVGVS